jgi:hypothetical protein
LNVHPAKMMVRVWVFTWALFLIMPFHIVGRPMTYFGGVMFAMFFLAFCLGAVLVRIPEAKPFPVPPQPLDWASVDRLIKIVCLISIAALAFEAARSDVFDLTEAYRIRNLAAHALLTGAQSNSSVAFQIAFLTYPASYVFIVRKVVFDEKMDVLSLLVYGIGPTALASIVMGGRGPVFYSLILGLIALTARRKYLGKRQGPINVEQRRRRRHAVIGVSIALIIATIYSANVFLVRAGGADGASALLDVVETVWPVSFRGPGSEFLYRQVGETLGFLIMMAGWYIVQGIVMSNYLFSSYDGPMQWGVYGIDLAAAVVRRIDPATVSSNFGGLNDLGTYGFLPTAFGTLWVDYGYLGLGVAGAWGYFCSVVFRKGREGQDARWLLLPPFITAGILFSINNTPFGMSNGLMIYFWLYMVFRKVRIGTAPQPDLVMLPAE